MFSGSFGFFGLKNFYKKIYIKVYIKDCIDYNKKKSNDKLSK